MPASNREPFRTALVTGANRGLGFETSRELAQRGLRVLLASRRDTAGREAETALVGEGLSVEAVTLDVADAHSIDACAAQLDAHQLFPDVLVNNAGISMRGFDANVARRTLEVNFFGALHVTERLVPRMRDGGNIVMVSSGLGQLSGYSDELRARFLDPALGKQQLIELMETFVRDVERGRHVQAGWPSSAYGVSKAGLNALARILARELAGRQIRVNAVCPGWVRTDMGGAGAPRTVAQGAASIVWAALLPKGGPSGGFFRDGQPVPW